MGLFIAVFGGRASGIVWGWRQRAGGGQLRQHIAGQVAQLPAHRRDLVVQRVQLIRVQVDLTTRIRRTSGLSGAGPVAFDLELKRHHGIRSRPTVMNLCTPMFALPAGYAGTGSKPKSSQERPRGMPTLQGRK